jgi:hypothetical protein
VDANRSSISIKICIDRAAAGIGQSHLIKTRMSPVPGFGALEIHFSIILSAVPAFNPGWYDYSLKIKVFQNPERVTL